MLSSAQKRLYVLYRLEPDGIAYNMPFVIGLKDSIDKNKIKNTFQKIIKRHESLRTSFEMINEEPVQIIHKEMECDFEYYEASHYSQSSQPVTDIIEGFVRPFDLSKLPLFRVGLIKELNNHYTLLLDLHHIIADEISTAVFKRDFLALYNGEEPSPLKLQYKDYSQWKNRENQREILKKQEQYWLGQFEDNIPVLNIPNVLSVDGELNFKGDTFEFTIEPTLNTAIKKCILGFGTTLNIFLLAVYNVLLAKYTAQDDILVGTVIAGREHPDLFDMIGFFVNMLAMRNRPEGNKTFSEFLAEVTKNALAGYENQGYPFEELVSKLEIPRRPGKHPLIDTVFVFRDAEEATFEIENTTEQNFKINHFKISHFDIMLYAAAITETINMSFEYSTQIFKKTTIEKFARGYVEILEQVIKNRDIQLKEIKISHDFLIASPDKLQKQDIEFDF